MPSSYADDLRADSLTEIAAGRKPLRRTEFGGTTRPPRGAQDVFVEIGRGGIDRSVLALAEGMTRIGPGTVRLVFPSTVEVAALCDKLHKRGKADLEHIIGVSASFIVSSRVVVLTRALEQAYWLPDGIPSTIANWRKMLGIHSSVSSLAALAQLTDLVTPAPYVERDLPRTDPDKESSAYRLGSHVLDDLLARIELNAITETGWTRTANAAAEQYRASCVISENWSTALSMDPLGRAELVESGFCVEAELPDDRSGELVLPLADEHTACKLKAGTALRIVGQPDEPTVNAQLQGIDYINDRLHLTVRPVRGSRDVLALMPTSVLLTPQPFGTVKLKPNPVNRWGTKYGGMNAEAVAPIDMPVDLLLAGAPTDG